MLKDVQLFEKKRWEVPGNFHVLKSIKILIVKVFKEEQRFTQLWLIALIIFSTILPISITINQASNMTTSQLLITLSVIFLSPTLIFVFKFFFDLLTIVFVNCFKICKV